MIKYEVTVSNGTLRWTLDGNLHREDGPAVEHADGRKTFYLDGHRLSQEQHAFLTRPIKELTTAEIEFVVGHRVIVKEKPEA